ncbi:5461_t:CDS:1, partial [Acaulospora morrowiae]
NDSIESFLTSNFDSLFDVDDIYFSSASLPFLSSYSTLDIETLENYFKEWIVQYDRLELVKRKADENMLKMIYNLRKPFLSLLVVLTMDYEHKNGVPPTSKILRGLVAEKMMTILCIDGRQERRYWSGM